MIKALKTLYKEIKANMTKPQLTSYSMMGGLQHVPKIRNKTKMPTLAISIHNSTERQERPSPAINRETERQLSKKLTSKT